MLKKIAHLGLIVKDIEDSAKLFSESLGFKRDTASASLDSSGEFRSLFIASGEVMIELISPVKPGSPLSNFLEKRGEGVHHISIEVDNIDRELDSLKAKGSRLINEKAVLVGDSRVAFIHPGSTKGVLIELTQRV